jgi:GAF domain-containing protein
VVIYSGASVLEGMNRMVWSSDDGLDLVFALIGVLMGGVFVLSSWRSSLKGTDLKNDPRIKNLIWATMVFLAAFFGRWEKLLDSSDLNHTRLALFYLIPLLITVFAGVAAISVMIFARFASMRRVYAKKYGAESLGAVLDYLHYGYKHYQEEYEAPLRQENEERLQRFRELNAEGSTRLAVDILAVERYHQDPSDALRDALCRQILDHIRLVVQSYTATDTKVRLNANIMVAVAAAQASEEDWEQVRFAYQEREDYSHLLILKHYASPEGQQHFAVPVVDSAKFPKWRDWVLFGGPDAFLREAVLVIQTSNLDFAKHIPQDTREEIRSYFKGKEGLRSFACLPVLGEGSLRGIVNVESDQEHIFQESEEVQSEIASVLQPFCVLLGSLAQ